MDIRGVPGGRVGPGAAILSIVTMTSTGWRKTAVWLHVVTSVGWMSQALALCVLLLINMTTTDLSVRISAVSMARVLDDTLLAPLANASAFTGIMLATATAWGLFRFWWVLTKFAITLVQLYAGIFVLSGALRDAVAVAQAGGQGSAAQVVGTALMASAIAFQAWLSVLKPWQRTPWTSGGTRARKLPTARRSVFVLTVAAPIVDIAIGTVAGFPAPLVSLTVLLWRVVARRAEVHGTRVGGEPAG